MTHAPRSSLSPKHVNCGWQSATQTQCDNDVHVRPLTNRLTTAANAQPRGPAPTTKPASHPTGDNVQTVDKHDPRAPNLPNRRPRPSQNVQISRVPAPMMGTDTTSPTPDDGIKTHQTQSMAAWATTRMRKVYISQNTEIVVQKITHCTRN